MSWKLPRNRGTHRERKEAARRRKPETTKWDETPEERDTPHPDRSAE